MVYTTLNTNKIMSYSSDNQVFNFEHIAGELGTLLCFTGYIWDLRCIRYVLWLQRYSQRFENRGISTVLVLPTHKRELSSFLMSIPQDINFLLVADPQNGLLTQFEMEKSGFVLLDTEKHILKRWYADDAVYIGVRQVLDFLQ